MVDGGGGGSDLDLPTTLFLHNSPQTFAGTLIHSECFVLNQSVTYIMSKFQVQRRSVSSWGTESKGNLSQKLEFLLENLENTNWVNSTQEQHMVLKVYQDIPYYGQTLMTCDLLAVSLLHATESNKVLYRMQ